MSSRVSYTRTRYGSGCRHTWKFYCMPSIDTTEKVIIYCSNASSEGKTVVEIWPEYGFHDLFQFIFCNLQLPVWFNCFKPLVLCTPIFPFGINNDQVVELADQDLWIVPYKRTSWLLSIWPRTHLSRLSWRSNDLCASGLLHAQF